METKDCYLNNVIAEMKLVPTQCDNQGIKIAGVGNFLHPLRPLSFTSTAGCAPTQEQQK
jgi:hypothetical protein